MTVYVKKGANMDYLGAFYPTEQVSGSESEWEDCCNGLNLVLASFDNLNDSSFAANAVGFTNYFGSHVALIWDVNYAYLRASYNQQGTEANLKDAMDEVKNAIDALQLTSAQKKDLWNQMNWGGFVADEPISNPGGNQNTDAAIQAKCNAIKNVFNHEEYSGWWDLGEPKILIVLHREGNTGSWYDNSGDSLFHNSKAETWHGYGVNQWGMDTYIQTTEDDTKIRSDRNYFYDELVDLLELESKDSKFMVMVGRAFSQTKKQGDETCMPGYPNWLSETKTWYYYNRAKEYDAQKELTWRLQFSALLWWAYCTDALADEEPEPGCIIQNHGFDSNSDVEQYVFDIADDNSPYS